MIAQLPVLNFETVKRFVEVFHMIRKAAHMTITQEQ